MVSADGFKKKLEVCAEAELKTNIPTTAAVRIKKIGEVARAVFFIFFNVNHSRM